MWEVQVCCCDLHKISSQVGQVGHKRKVKWDILVMQYVQIQPGHYAWIPVYLYKN